MTHHQIIETYFQTLNARDWTGFAATLHEQVLYEMPQTRERVRGREAYLDFNITYPFNGEWSLEVMRLVVDDLRGAAEMVMRVDGQIMSALVFFEFRDGLIVRITDYWPESYEPPVRVSKFVERT